MALEEIRFSQTITGTSAVEIKPSPALPGRRNLIEQYSFSLVDTGAPATVKILSGSEQIWSLILRPGGNPVPEDFGERRPLACNNNEALSVQIPDNPTLGVIVNIKGCQRAAQE